MPRLAEFRLKADDYVARVIAQIEAPPFLRRLVCRDELEKYLFNEMYLILKDVVDEVSAGLNISDENKAFVANFYKSLSKTNGYLYIGHSETLHAISEDFMYV